MTKRILTVVGTRPNFIKVTQFRKAASKYPHLDLKIVHTGQHYDGKMADVFFEQFGLVPDYFLNVQPGSPNSQMAAIMLGLEKLMLDYKPDLVMVVGDVNSTLAAAITANKMGVRLAHVESGLRSFDRTMPEEFNRLLTDELCDLLFVTEQSGLDHLRKEGKPEERIHFVGNTMIDTLVAFKDQVAKSDILQKLGLSPKSFVLMTMHRPVNVDSAEGLTKLIDLLEEITKHESIVFPVHPRTVKNMQQFGLEARFKNNKRIILTEPLDYFAFQQLILNSRYILTDSGGIQEETTFLRVPCLTIRPNTERPITITMGTNELLPFDTEQLLSYIEKIRNGSYKKGQIPPLWDGKATERIFEVVSRSL